jgi:hypothetical protein
MSKVLIALILVAGCGGPVDEVPNVGSVVATDFVVERNHAMTELEECRMSNRVLRRLGAKDCMVNGDCSSRGYQGICNLVDNLCLPVIIERRSCGS